MAGSSVRAYRFRITRAGWAFLGLTLSFGVHGVLAGNNSIFLIFSLMAGFCLSLAVLTAAMPFFIVVRRRLPEAAHAGTDFNYQLEIRNGRRFGPACCLQVRDDPSQGGGRPAMQEKEHACGDTCETGWLSAGEAATVTLRLSSPARGWLNFRGLFLRGHFPFGLFEADRYLPVENRLVVYPERWVLPAQLSIPGLDRVLAGSDHLARFITGGSDFAGLREFQPGDDPRQIHWHASGRLPDQILARQVEPQRDHQIAIVLDSFFGREEEDRCRGAFEDNICLALALVEKLLAEQCELTFVGWHTGPRAFRLNPLTPELQELRLWLATLEPDPEHTLLDVIAQVKLPPQTMSLLLCLPGATEFKLRWPGSCVELKLAALKATAQIKRSGSAAANAATAKAL